MFKLPTREEIDKTAEIVAKWEATGLLKDVPEDKRAVVSCMLEKQQQENTEN